MNTQEKNAVGDRILALIEKEYHGYVAHVVAYTIGIAEKVPAQANNEIQNALNHLAIAYVSSDPAAADKQLSLAEEHLERATRDCLKICLIKRRSLLDDLVVAIEDKYGTILRPARTSLRNIAVERDRILFEESRGSKEVSDLLSKLLAECNDLYEYFLDNYPVPSTLARRRSKIIRWLWRNAPGFVLGVAASMFAAYLYFKLGLPSHS
jgi:hypothetical protein